MDCAFLSQFCYCPLVWIFHSPGKNKKVNPLHESSLRIIYGEKKSTFMELLETEF